MLFTISRNATLASLLALLPLPIAASGATARTEQEPKSDVRMITLGTGGGPVVRLNRNQASTALVINGKVYLVDVGYGAVRQMAAAGLPLGDVKAVFITHHHIDHTADLSALLALRWVFQEFSPLLVAGPPGTTREVTKLVEAHYETEIARTNNGPLPPSMSKIYSGNDFPGEAPAPIQVYSDENVKVSAILNTHYHFPAGTVHERHARSYSLRFETKDGVVVFTGDTGPSRNVELLAKGADILVSEIIDLDQTQKQLEGWKLDTVTFGALMEHMRTEHLTAEEVGKMATAAGVRKVVLSHIAPGRPQDDNDKSLVAGVKSTFSGSVELASDLDIFDVKK